MKKILLILIEQRLFKKHNIRARGLKNLLHYTEHTALLPAHKQTPFTNIFAYPHLLYLLRSSLTSKV